MYTALLQSAFTILLRTLCKYITVTHITELPLTVAFLLLDTQGSKESFIKTLGRGSHYPQEDMQLCMSWKVKVKSLSRVRLFATPWTVAYQAPLSMGFSRQECWSGLPLPSPEDLPNPGIKPWSPTLQEDALTSELPGLELGAIPVILNPGTSLNSMEEGWHLLLLKAFSRVSTTCVPFVNLLSPDTVSSLLFSWKACYLYY